jgi:peptide/nickel transport system substrate-binding protein
MARDLLTQTGWVLGSDGIFAKDSQKLSFSLTVVAGNKARDLVAQTMVQQLKEIGVEVIIRPIDAAAFFTDVLKTRRFETAMYAWVSGVDPDNLSLWNSRKIPARNNGYEGKNYPGWRNAEIDSLTEQGAHTLDIEARKQIYFRIQEIITTDYPVIPLYFRANIDAVKDTVINYQPNPTPSGNLWNSWQWGLALSTNK